MPLPWTSVKGTHRQGEWQLRVLRLFCVHRDIYPKNKIFFPEMTIPELLKGLFSSYHKRSFMK